MRNPVPRWAIEGALARLSSTKTIVYSSSEVLHSPLPGPSTPQPHQASCQAHKRLCAEKPDMDLIEEKRRFYQTQTEVGRVLLDEVLPSAKRILDLYARKLELQIEKMQTNTSNKPAD